MESEDHDDFLRILGTYDKDTLIDLLDGYMSNKEKIEFRESFYREG
jgi:hypothetical protein